MKKVNFIRTGEWYCDCPYCSTLIQFWHGYPNEGEKVVCEKCKKSFKAGVEQDEY